MADFLTFLFYTCCKLLSLIGQPLGLDYWQISVYICIYVVPLICVLSACRVWYKIRSWPTLVYLGVNILVCAWIYYLFGGLNVYLQFYLCEQWLRYLAEDLGTTYINLNIYIYVFGFFGILIMNELYLWFKTRGIRKREETKEAQDLVK